MFQWEPDSNQTPLSAAAEDLVENGATLVLLPHLGSAKRSLCLADQIEEPPNANLSDQRRRAHQHDLFEKEVGQSVALREWRVWRLVSRRMRPAPVFNYVDATGPQPWEEEVEGRFCLLVSVRCVVDHQIELID